MTRTVKLAITTTLTIAAGAAAQPGSRSALVYGARLPGETAWHFGSLNTIVALNEPVTFEIGAFYFYSQGVGFDFSVYKTYVDMPPASGSVAIVEDTSNGVPGTGTDGRVGVFNFGPHPQSVFVNRNALVPGVGFRIANALDTKDFSNAGGISGAQALPTDPLTHVPNPNFETADGVLGYRFDVTFLPRSSEGSQTAHVHTPRGRVNSFKSYSTLDVGDPIDLLPILELDSVDVSATWIPTPGSLPLLVLSSLAFPRRRR